MGISGLGGPAQSDFPPPAPSNHSVLTTATSALFLEGTTHAPSAMRHLRVIALVPSSAWNASLDAHMASKLQSSQTQCLPPSLLFLHCTFYLLTHWLSDSFN